MFAKPSTRIDPIHKRMMPASCVVLIFSCNAKKLMMVAHMIASCVIEMIDDTLPPNLFAKIYAVVPTHHHMRYKTPILRSLATSHFP